MSLKSLEQGKLLDSLKSTDKLTTKLRGAFVRAPACVRKKFLVKSRNCQRQTTVPYWQA